MSKVYYPKKIDSKYVWQCAYADASASHDVLPSYIYDCLTGHNYNNDKYARKSYDTYDQATKALVNSLQLIKDGIQEYSKVKLIE